MRSHRKISLQVATLVATCVISIQSLAWGERGHDLITRVAATQLEKLCDNDAACYTPFKKRAHMLSHLSNAPDFLWRSATQSKRVKDLNYPTHYISLDAVYEKPAIFTDIDFKYTKYREKALIKNRSTHNASGSAPWRVLQLHTGMVENFQKAASAESYEQRIEAINQALKMGGLMSHFVGDLANPHHTADNHDGQLTGNTGLHAYFESEVVGELAMDLASRVSKKANPRLLKKTILKPYSKAQANEILASAEKLIFALVLDSNKKVDYLTSLDNSYSLIKKSEEPRVDAERRPAFSVRNKFRPFIAERLAVGAQVLAHLWRLAWVEGGQPDMSDYHSYHYFVSPEFITPTYLLPSD